ncbi:hypothetical protein LguiB_008119 [Lonicera macranthoides]
MATTKLLLSQCRQILCSDDPVLYIREYLYSYGDTMVRSVSRNRVSNNLAINRSNVVKLPVSRALELEFLAPPCREVLCRGERLAAHMNSKTKWTGMEQLNSVISNKKTVVSGVNPDPECCDCNGDSLQQLDDGVPLVNGTAPDKPTAMSSCCIGEENVPHSDKVLQDKNRGVCVPPPGKKFYLNRLRFVGHGSSEHNTVSLPELLYPVGSLLRIFIATFTSDILWFLSYCEVPAHIPVTIACHNAGRCWSSSIDARTSVPYADFPHVVILYPPFPEVIAFGKDRKKLGIACHHPKLFVLQREDSIRVIITSANLVPKQWHVVSNTVWWQDFPRASAPDYSSLFTQSSDGEINQDSKSDFAAQLAGFMASLVADVPSQAHWILQLTMYDFKGAVGHLVASMPGIHSPKAPYISDSKHVLTGNQPIPRSCSVKLLGSVEASVVGLSHLFRTSTDYKGMQLKKLASFLGRCHENAFGMSEIILMRNTNIPADTNAVSVLIPNPEDVSEEDCVQLGFLPRNIAKWVAPLADIGFFSFSAYIYPKEALANALEGSNNKLQLILYVSQGPTFVDMSVLMTPVHVSALCLLIASIQRCTGLWRLREVLGHHKWPEHSETDFVFGSSSVGSINAQFLAAFSAAAGKRSLQFSESEESDPDWGCWSASQESRNPSIRIIFPTIERVKTASCGIWASKYLLCFSQKTWLRLRNVGILHDAIPYPLDRLGHPMHFKVARRRFQSKTDTSSCGWVYCGSHNFSAAAWGRPISSTLGIHPSGAARPNNPVLGSRLHICNYELGIIFIVPPSDIKVSANKKSGNLDDIVLPFVVPAPKYRARDRPATAQTMREALAELTEQEKERFAEALSVGGLMEEEEEILPDEEEAVLEDTDYVAVEKEDDKVYGEKLWSQVDSSNG